MLHILLVVLAALAQPAPAPSPAIASFSPDNTPATIAASVQIQGTNFVSGATVKFGVAEAASVNVIDAQTIVAVTPPSPNVAAVRITVTNPDGQSAVSSGFFTFTASSPVITGISPDIGSTAGGYELTITGFNLRENATIVLHNETSATELEIIRVEGTTKLIAMVPIGPSNFERSLSTDVVVTNPTGRSVAAIGAFTWIQPPLAIHHISPPSGPVIGGTQITITGEGFSKAARPQVIVGGFAARAVGVVDAVTLEVVVPAGVRGGFVPIFMRNDLSSTEKPDAFFYEGGDLPKRRSSRR